ncbi:MAG: benzoate-CoA ligase family protein [Hyphomonadaceae bacterium]|nr:benzoate-CoA ligase family protein [Hyphomonadaceae bacterium]
MSGHVDTFVRDNLPPRDMWPEMTFTLPELQFPAQYNASSILDAATANGHGNRNAVLFSSATLSYEALLEEASRIAHVLTHEYGLIPGNRVLIHASNTRHSIAVWWGVLRAGGVAVGTMPMLRAHELAVILNKAQITHAIVDAHRATEIEQARADAPVLKHIISTDDLDQRMANAPTAFPTVATAADDPALIAFTSGTTGTPKGCVHFHRDIAAMAETFSRHVLQPAKDDVFIGTPPLAFTFGLGAGVVFPASVGAATVICDKPGFDVLADTIEKHKATTLFTSPTGYRALMKQDLSKLASLHTCVSAGEHLPQATSDQWFERTGIRIIDGIGSTEMIHIFISARGDDIRPGATGKAVPGYEATLLDENDQPFEGEGEGRLAIRGPTACRYLADERQKNYVANGWNVTGDLYRRDADGYFWYVSRADDMIISSGYNIGAPEVENALLTHDAVAECAVVGAPDSERGQIVKAFVVLKPGAEVSTQALQDHVKQTIAPYKYPRAIEFVAELPKTHTGKLQRFKLRENT